MEIQRFQVSSIKHCVETVGLVPVSAALQQALSSVELMSNNSSLIDAHSLFSLSFTYYTVAIAKEQMHESFSLYLACTVLKLLSNIMCN